VIEAVGTDIVELDRIRRVLGTHRERFLDRVFAAVEVEYCLSRTDPVPSLAVRFAAKEAFQKCWRVSHGWRDVWVERDGPRPVIATCEPIGVEMAARGLRAHLSLSHSRDLAVATVVLERY
jgi:holo-[acyl-carrier protein] synthase